MTTKAWREAVVTHLRKSFPSSQVVSGRAEAESPSRRQRDHLAVFSSDYEVSGRSTSLAEPVLTIWYSPPRPKTPSTSMPWDPGPLEDASDALIAAFPRATQVGGFFVANLACRLTRVVKNDSEAVWRVEATLQAYTLTGAA